MASRLTIQTKKNPLSGNPPILWHDSAQKAPSWSGYQFKLLHRSTPTNDFLLKIGRKEKDNCTLCNNSSETVNHPFWSGHVTPSFWKSLTDWLQYSLPINGKYSLLNITLWGLRPEPHSTEYSLLFNYYLLQSRFCIWQAKTNETLPNFCTFSTPG